MSTHGGAAKRESGRTSAVANAVDLQPDYHLGVLLHRVGDDDQGRPSPPDRGAQPAPGMTSPAS
jgi:hypothetical protein